MDLELTDEQRLLSGSVETLLERSGEADEIWDRLVEFGALMVGEEALGGVELCLICRSLGGHLASIPYLGSAATRYAVAEIDPAPAAFAELAEDSSSIVLALLEAERGWLSTDLATTLRANGDGWLLDGGKSAVELAKTADRMLVTALCDGAPALVLVDRDSAGVEVSPQDSIDAGAPLHRASFAAVPVAADRVLSGADAAAAMARLQAIGGLLAAAEANGASGAMLDEAVEYAGQRRQFGRTIGSNQALRHILADMYVRQSSSWSSILYSAAALDDAAAEADRTASIAKAYASRATREVAHGAMQVFGGIAFTEEHDAHRFLRRVNLRGAQFGDAGDHERALGRALVAAALP